MEGGTMNGKHAKSGAESSAGSRFGGAPGPLAGITLIELLTAMAILAVLVTLAWPAYTDSLRKARRIDAVTALHEVQLHQERYHAAHYHYAEQLSDLGYADDEMDSPQQYYRVRLHTPETGTDYLVVAEPRPGSDQVRDACGPFAMSAAGPVPGQPADPACWPR